MIRPKWEMEILDQVAWEFVFDAIENKKIKENDADKHAFLSGFWRGLNESEYGVDFEEGFEKIKKEVVKEFGKFGSSTMDRMVEACWWGYDNGYYLDVNSVLNNIYN